MPNGVPFTTNFNDVFCTNRSINDTLSPIPLTNYGNWNTTNNTFKGRTFANGSFTRNVFGIKNDGTLWGWGAQWRGYLGNNICLPLSFANYISSPIQTVAGGNTWCSLSGSGSFRAGLKTDGTLWMWGYNNGYLGTNSTVSASSPVQTIAGGTNWKQVTTSGINVGAIKTDGTLWVWGNNNYGQIGNNQVCTGFSTPNSQSSPVQTIAGGTNWSILPVDFSSGALGAIKTDGTLWMWGKNGAGQLGTNTIVTQSSPVQTIAGGTNWCALAIGGATALIPSTYGFTAALKTDGTLWVWGRNTFGQLGTNATVNQSSPVQTIAGGTNWLRISAENCYPEMMGAIKTDGTLWLWGCNSYGNIGDGTKISKSSPVQTITGGTGWNDLSLSSNGAVAIKNDGKMWIWGGQLGSSVISGGTTILKNTYCFADMGKMFVEKDYLIDVYPNLVPQQKTSTLWMWGSNSSGTLGINSIVNQSSPVQTIAGGTNWQSIDTAVSTTAAIKTDGTLWMWGLGSVGRLGDNTAVSKSSPVQTIAGGTNWKQVSAGGTTGALKTDGTLWVWGVNYCGNLGINSVVNRSSPVQTISGGSNWKQISIGGPTAGIKTDGTLWVWGPVCSGALGDNTAVNKSSPVQTIAGGTNWKQVSASYVTGAIKTDGTLWMWGQNTTGTLGIFNVNNQSSPVQTVSGGTNWKCITAATATAALKTDGTLWLWGTNTTGYMGDNTVVSKSSPVQTITGGSNWKALSIKASQSGFMGAIREEGDW